MPNSPSSFFLGFFLTRRFRPALVPTLAALLLVAATSALGNWQRHRAEQKEALREQFELASRQPPLVVSANLGDPMSLRYRAVRARGVYDATHQFLIDNKVVAGRAGYDVVTPLKLSAGGEYVLVDRGWIALGERRADLPAAPPPAGEVDVEGRVNFPPAHYLELSANTGVGPVIQNLDLTRIATTTGLSLLPFLVEQTGATADGLRREWPVPDFGIEQHRSYMLQWFSFAALGIVLWLTLNWRRNDEGDTRANSDVKAEGDG
jgi:surfeit locus 1 family protein